MDVAETPVDDAGHRLVISKGHVWLRPSWHLRVVEGRRRSPGCEIRSRSGEFDGVAASPDGHLAAVRWTDQTEAGLVLVELGETPPQLEHEWETRETNWLEGPVWTLDSETLVVVENPAGAGPWWAEGAPGEADDDDVSPGGTFSPGSLVVLDRNLRERARQTIEVALPPGWVPSDDADRCLGTPRIVAAGEVAVSGPPHSATGGFRLTSPRETLPRRRRPRCVAPRRGAATTP